MGNAQFLGSLPAKGIIRRGATCPKAAARKPTHADHFTYLQTLHLLRALAQK
ncbi:hypothetical protein EVA_06474 [gut metagenome]|uniref:Uncharacterized protein n=1 Tax=gut metagenome TaxID=749906 RepID=J9GET9_9ZZZZ